MCSFLKEKKSTWKLLLTPAWSNLEPTNSSNRTRRRQRRTATLSNCMTKNNLRSYLNCKYLQKREPTVSQVNTRKLWNVFNTHLSHKHIAVSYLIKWVRCVWLTISRQQISVQLLMLIHQFFSVVHLFFWVAIDDDSNYVVHRKVSLFWSDRFSAHWTSDNRCSILFKVFPLSYTKLAERVHAV